MHRPDQLDALLQNVQPRVSSPVASEVEPYPTEKSHKLL